MPFFFFVETPFYAVLLSGLLSHFPVNRHLHGIIAVYQEVP